MLIRIIKKTDNYDNWIEYIDDRPFNDIRYYISNNKLKQLGWNISTSFDNGIDELINNSVCYKDVSDEEDVNWCRREYY